MRNCGGPVLYFAQGPLMPLRRPWVRLSAVISWQSVPSFGSQPSCWVAGAWEMWEFWRYNGHLFLCLDLPVIVMSPSQVKLCWITYISGQAESYVNVSKDLLTKKHFQVSRVTAKNYYKMCYIACLFGCKLCRYLTHCVGNTAFVISRYVYWARRIIRQNVYTSISAQIHKDVRLINQFHAYSLFWVASSHRQ